MNLPPESPVFIFPFARPLTGTEQQASLEQVQSFLAQWNSHGDPVKATAWFEEGVFLVIAADSSVVSPSGCSKDKLYHFIEKHQKALAIPLAETGHFFVKMGHEIRPLPKTEIKKLWMEEKLTFDNQLFPVWVDTLARFTQEWGKPLSAFNHLLKLAPKQPLETE